MSQPTPYVPATNFTADEAASMGGRSTIRTSKIDAELAALQLTLGQILANLKILQRDDTALADGIVTLASLNASIAPLFLAGNVVARGGWLTATSYAARDFVAQGSASYLCVTPHVSGVFATDLAAGRWIVVSASAGAYPASSVTVTPAGGIAATNAQAALEELDTEKLAKASNLSDVANIATALANLGALAKAGGTMTGMLTLAGSPAATLDAATKGYVDTNLAGMNIGQCRFSLFSNVLARLMPYNGNRIFVQGTWLSIPNTGANVSSTGVAANTLYYFYAYNNGGAVALEWSTTAPGGLDATYGHYTKTGDPSRTLVGAHRTGTFANQFETANPLNTLSWFNRVLKTKQSFFTVDRTHTSAVGSEINSEIAQSFLSWGDGVRFDATGVGSCSLAANDAKVFFGLNSSFSPVGYMGTRFKGTDYTPFAISAYPSLGGPSQIAAYNTVSLGAISSAATTTFSGDVTTGVPTQLTVSVMG